MVMIISTIINSKDEPSCCMHDADTKAMAGLTAVDHPRPLLVSLLVLNLQ